MYRTDKQFMKNPATAPSRIYIGGIPKTIIADDLEAKFSRHGKILGLVINSGFAFIQYEYEVEAQNAIRAENGTMMMGRKVTVRQAFAGKDMTGSQNKGPMQNQPPRGPPPPVPPQNLENPMESKNTPFENVGENDVEHQDEEMETGPNIRPPTQKFEERRGGGRMGGPRGGGNIGRNKQREKFEEAENFTDRGPGNYYDDYVGGLPIADMLPSSDRNDCEIIVVSRALTEYAEFIESRLKHIGLIVDLLFPNEDVPIGKVLANISSRGCLYAILVMPQNEEHRSLTLNVLHGIPQEHRNMPLDDALLLIQRNFEGYMRGEKAPEDPVKMSLADRHPVPVQMLLNLLAENRMLTTAQYDKLIKYLQERRELQREHELSEGVVRDQEEGGSSKDKQSELQNRILSILNKSADNPIPKSITAPESNAPVQEAAASAPLLKDPSVQKALDSILAGDMFKTIASGL